MSSKPLTCIWMDAGIVPYKLCPFEYDCDHCEFYLEVTGKQKKDSKPSTDRQLELCLKRPEAGYFNPGTQYYQNHMWLKRTGQNRIIVGPDDFMLSLLPSVENVVLTPVGKTVRENGCLAWVQLPFCVLYINSPVAGTVVEHNLNLKELFGDKNEYCDHPSSEFWFVKLSTESSVVDRSKWLTKPDYSRLLSDDWNTVRAMIGEEYQTPVGTASADGGEIQGLATVNYESYRMMIQKVSHGFHQIK